MNSAELAREISRGKGLLAEIVRVTSDFLERFGILAPAEVHAFEARRQLLLEEFLVFQSRLKQKLAGMGKDLPLTMAGQLEEFRIFQEVFVQIVMEKNAAIISEANRSLERVRSELDAVGRGRQALRGYNRQKGQPWKTLENMV